MGTAALWKDAAPFELSPVRQVQAHELVVDQIRTAIMLGRFRQGETLPTERQLAAFLQASRTTVQEAVSILASEGILDVRRGRGGGLFVRAFTADEEAVRRTLSAHHDRMTEVFDFRLAVESFAAKYAAERRTKADLRELRQLLAAMDELRASMHGNDSSLTAQFVQADTRFHLRIAETARSPWLHRSVAMARVEMFRPVGAIFKHLEPAPTTCTSRSSTSSKSATQTKRPALCTSTSTAPGRSSTCGCVPVPPRVHPAARLAAGEGGPPAESCRLIRNPRYPSATTRRHSSR